MYEGILVYNTVKEKMNESKMVFFDKYIWSEPEYKRRLVLTKLFLMIDFLYENGDRSDSEDHSWSVNMVENLEKYMV
jgi:hypothetical protein